jgi:hypothetical protein
MTNSFRKLDGLISRPRQLSQYSECDICGMEEIKEVRFLADMDPFISSQLPDRLWDLGSFKA